LGLTETLQRMLGKSRPLTPQQRVAAAKAALREAREQLALVTPQQANRPIWTDWSTANAIQNGLKASEWVYTCVRKRASAISSVPWFAEQRVGEDEWERDDLHPLSNLLSRPNPQMSRQDLMERTLYHLDLGGNALWHLERNSAGIPQNIVPLMPDQIKPVPTGSGLEVARYEYRMGSKKQDLTPEEVCHLMFVDPGDLFWGLAPLRAAMQTVDTDVEAVRWNKVSLQNRAVTDGLFAFKHPLTTEQWEDAQEQVKEQHLGAEHAHLPWILGADASYTQMSLSPVEMDFLKSRLFNVATICGVFGVPVVLVAADRSNSLAGGSELTAARQLFWTDTVIPTCDDIQDALDLRLTPYWNPEGLKDASKKTLRIGYDVSQVPAMRELWAARVATAKSIWDMGVPFNGVNQRLELGFGEVEGGDLPWGGSKPPTLGYAPISELPKTALPALELKSGMAADEKAAYYKAFDNDRARWESRIAKQISTLFTAEGEAVVAAFEDGGKAAITGAIERNKTQWAAWLAEAYKQMIVHFGTLEGRRIIRAIPKSALPELERKDLERKERAWAFDFDDPAVEHFIRSETAQKVTAMSQTTRDAIAEGVAEGLSQNEGASDIAKRIRASYADWAGEGDTAMDRSRSFLIARTEAGAAVNFGHNMGALQVEKQTGATILKEWISSRDDRVRDSHAAVDGEMRGLHESFSNGLLYPNAPGAPAAEVCNCRCALAHLVEGVSA